ncbi:S-formylglutathione hydrolase [Croceicoccus sp. F390]|uniref:S-formylglutathione hydrolase n=1 Tax=Croceicoccus esteveae TaxID=3075597 RepID=A0ABU2ZID7_9SPHN|nr:S-formylglutathione hydrolase [Croceicoccus sp. F390]MDT0576064.1 S-formylglutathione hydrolase [Croceicoccus sp. F390]
MTMKTIWEHRSHDGVQGMYSHASGSAGRDMAFGVFVPDHAPGATLPVLWYLSGLTCTAANVVEKGEYRAACARHGIILVAPDTSPRGEGVADDADYDLGVGAGFYVDATQQPWAANYRMRSYVEEELPAIVRSQFPADFARQSITGHSMGGHGALTIALRNPQRFRSVSAFAPLCAPMQCSWGEKAFSNYLGTNRQAWRPYDAVALIEDGARLSELLVDQGTADQFLTEQLKPQLLHQACTQAGIDATIRMQEGYDHSYFFISTFMSDHVEWHAARLKQHTAHE